MAGLLLPMVKTGIRVQSCCCCTITRARTSPRCCCCCCTANQTKWIMAKWADIITAHDRNLRNGCLHVELESIENEAIWTDTFNCNTIHILVSLSLVNWTVGQVSFDGLVSPSISIICFTEEGKSFFQIDSCVSVVPGQSIKEEKEPILQSQLLLYLLFHLKRVWNEIWSEIQIFNQFATFPLIFVYTSVIHLYCSHCAIQLFRSNCTIVSSGLFTGICCKKLSPTFLFRWPAKNWRQEHRLFDNGFLGIWRLGLPCSKMASKTYMQCNAHRKITFRWKKNSEIAQNVSNGLISSS